MKFNEDTASTGHLIRRYETGALWVGAQCFSTAVALNAEQIISPWQGASAAEISAEAYAALLQLSPEIVVIGTGSKQCFAKPELLQALYVAQVGVEQMSTAAACRTFNILRAEGRNVVAGLIP